MLEPLALFDFQKMLLSVNFDLLSYEDLLEKNPSSKFKSVRRNIGLPQKTYHALNTPLRLLCSSCGSLFKRYNLMSKEEMVI